MTFEPGNLDSNHEMQGEGDNRHLRCLKISLSRTIDLANTFLTEDITTIMSDECKERIAELNKNFDELKKAIDEAVEKLKNPEELYNDLTICQQHYCTTRQAIKIQLWTAENDNNNDSANLSHGRGNSNNKTTRLDKGLKPFTMTKAHSPTDLHLWKQQLDDCIDSGKLSTSGDLSPEDIHIQCAHLLRCMDENLLKALEAKVLLDTPIFGPDGCLEALDRIFIVLYPVFYHQLSLLNVWQSDKDHLSYMERINRQSLEVDFENLNREAYCILHFATTVNNAHLRDKIIALENPTHENATKVLAKYVTTQVLSNSIDKQNQQNGTTFTMFHNAPNDRHGTVKPNVRSKQIAAGSGHPCPQQRQPGHVTGNANERPPNEDHPGQGCHTHKDPDSRTNTKTSTKGSV